MNSKLIYEQHMHTPLCRHAFGQPEEYAAAARQRGMRGIVVTCHNPMPVEYSPETRMSEGDFEEYVCIVERARAAFDGDVDVRLGIECDYFPGYESYLEKQLASAPFEHVLGSIHPVLPMWMAQFGKDGPLEAQRHYFRQLADAAETNLFDTISHPDLIKNMWPGHWSLHRIMDDVKASLDRIATTGVAMELNTSGLLKAVPEMNPNPAMLAEMAQRKIPVVVGADAHVPERVGACFELAYELLEAVGYTHVSIFLERKRIEVPIADARRSLRAPQAA